MDYAKGNELSNYIQDKGLLSENETKRIFKQIHEAVTYMHNRSVIHRDLKPNNILFLDEERQKIVVIRYLNR